MPLMQDSLDINFAQGLDLKTDPKRIAFGKFLALENSVFTKGGLFQKRNGFGEFSQLPNSAQIAATFNNNLTAIGSTFQAYSAANQSWVNKGPFQPLLLSTLPSYRSSTNQSQSDNSVSSNGLLCTAFTDNVPSGGSNVAVYKYLVTDATTGQVIVPVTTLNSGTAPRVFNLGNWFLVVYSAPSTNYIYYVAINTVTLAVTAPVQISANYTPHSGGAIDGVVFNNYLFLAWNGNDVGGAVRLKWIDSNLIQTTPVIETSYSANLMSVTTDGSFVFVSFYNGTNAYTWVTNQQLLTVLSPTIIASGAIQNITASAINGVATVFYEIQNTYSYDSSIYSNYIKSRTITSSGSLGTAVVLARSVGLASQSFVVDSSIFVLAAYSSPYQPSYFLLNSSGQVVARLAYSNGGGYVTAGLPHVDVNGLQASVSYLYKDSVQAVDKSQNVQTAGTIYAQLGINQATFTIGTSNISTSEIGSNLNLTGGFLWAYDGSAPVEQNFFLWPDSVEATPSTSGGSMSAQQYYYQVTYEWVDNQGNLFRSAPSVPVGALTTTGSSSVTLNIPTLRLSYKSNVKICIYRWSAGQPIYHQVTQVLTPLLNDPTVDSVSFVDTLSDTSIQGNNILYTTGGVVEDTGISAVSATALYRSRLFALSSEDPNLIYYSKQVIEATPVEMSDLFSLYVAPTTGSQGSTGPVKCISAMDDKLIIFKENAIYYITGNGPDNTGANNDFSDPVFITSTVGCVNQQSIVFMPQGLMFQSFGKGIWLLGRDLSTQYIGAAVEDFNQYTVLSAINVPETNQVRFTLSNGVTLMYDYFYSQWGTFTGIANISSCIYQNLHTFINSYGQVFQETPGQYSDGSNPVVLKFTTGWLNMAGLQGYQRAYYFYLLGNYISPHKLRLQIAYDYNSSPTQTTVISPDNYSGVYGSAPLYGNGSYSIASREQWRVFLQTQKCQALQISLTEVYDPSYSTPAGAGLTLSGINLIYGLMSKRFPIRSANNAG